MSKALHPSLTVVFPAFNEAENIDEAIGGAVNALRALVRDWEIVVVDDGSTDQTGKRVEEWAERESAVRLVRHPTNRGYGAALRSGFRAARMDHVFFTDADLQFDLEELALLLPHTLRFDIVTGYRHDRQDPWNRRLNAWAWGRLVDAVFDIGVRDVNCAFKVFRREVLDQVVIRSTGAFVNTEVLAKARARGYRVRQVPVSHYPRTLGEQTGARPRVVARAFLELGILYGDVRGIASRGPVSTTVFTR
ncbi:MAG: glycosyltransferase family 2 protein [Myxococcota bacterium]|nr:glycosyltransferase family 2 protein [Myxococcota bacterium]